MNLPNFLIIGAPKAGTTSLYNFLAQHPEIYMSPVKEPHFFSYEGKMVNYFGPKDQKRCDDMFVTSFEKYKELFSKVESQTAIGEASAMYLYSNEAPSKINRYLPNVKLIIILRNPVDRAYSSFTHLVRDDREKLSFADALCEEEKRLAGGWMPFWGYRSMGYYYTHVKRYMDEFGSDRIKIYLYDELKKDYSDVLRNIYTFLGVSEDFVVDTNKEHNKSGIPRNRYLHLFLKEHHPVKSLFKPFFPNSFRRKLVHNLTNRNLRQPPKISNDDKEFLLKEYQEDILKTQALIGKNLSAWLT